MILVNELTISQFRPSMSLVVGKVVGGDLVIKESPVLLHLSRSLKLTSTQALS